MERHSILFRNVRYMIFICLCMAVNQVCSQVRTESQALEIAADFLNSQGIGNTTHLLCAGRKSDRLRTAAHSPYYIVNDNGNNVFVVVGGDDRMEKVLGFVRNATYTEGAVPDGLQWLLNEYQSQYEYIQNSGTYADAPAMFTYKYQDVAPLIKTQWAQSFPFNKYTPIVNGAASLAGCVAISLAQVMNYYQYPYCGIDSISYCTESDSIRLSCNFNDIRYYDWKNIKDDYWNIYTEMEEDAVSRLVYACGASLGMNYGNNFSSAYISDVAFALVNFYGYAPCADYCRRNYYPKDEWMEMLHNELENKRPVIYGGQDEDDGGHCFIIDGVSHDKYFHINWGWDGYCDGYFQLDALRPEAGMDYQYDQEAVMRISPTMVGTSPYVFYAENFEPITKSIYYSSSNVVTLKLNDVYNFSQMCTSVLDTKYFKGSLALAQYNKSGKLVKTFCQYDVTRNKWSMNWGYGWFNFAFASNEIKINRGDTCYIKPVMLRGNIVTPIRTSNYGETDYIVVTRKTSLQLQFFSAKEFEQATAIQSIPVSSKRRGQNGCYTIDGNKYAEPQRGINIIDGRKVWNGLR